MKTSLHTRTYTSFAFLNEVILKRQIPANVLATWYVLRTLTRDLRGPGRFTTVEVSKYIAKYLGVSRQHAYGVLQQGEGLWWYKGHDKQNNMCVYVTGLPEILKHFDILPCKCILPKLRVVEYPISVLKGSADDRRAHFYKTTICKNQPIPDPPLPTFDKELNRQNAIEHSYNTRDIKTQSKPLSRQKIEERTGVTRRTQRKYERQCNQRGDKVWTQYNYALVLELTRDEYQQFASGTRIDEPLAARIYQATNAQPVDGTKFRLGIYGGRRGIWEQLPNTYSDEARSVRNPLVVKLSAHRKSETNTSPGACEKHGADTNNGNVATFGDVSMAELHSAESSHPYVFKQTPKRQLEKSVLRRHDDYYIFGWPLRSHARYKRRGVWMTNDSPTR